MTHHYCSRCGDAIPNGNGHVRSESFRQVAYCGRCWLERSLQTSMLEMSISRARRRTLAGGG